MTAPGLVQRRPVARIYLLGCTENPSPLTPTGFQTLYMRITGTLTKRKLCDYTATKKDSLVRDSR